MSSIMLINDAENLSVTHGFILLKIAKFSMCFRIISPAKDGTFTTLIPGYDSKQCFEIP